MYDSLFLYRRQDDFDQLPHAFRNETTRAIRRGHDIGSIALADSESGCLDVDTLQDLIREDQPEAANFIVDSAIVDIVDSRNATRSSDGSLILFE